MKTSQNVRIANRINMKMQMRSVGAKWPKMGESKFLSPVRLPFRHTGYRQSRTYKRHLDWSGHWYPVFNPAQVTLDFLNLTISSEN